MKSGLAELLFTKPEAFGERRLVVDVHHTPGNVLAENRALLEGLRRSTPRKPHVVEIGVLVDDEIPADAGFIVAGTSLIDRLIHETREVVG